MKFLKMEVFTKILSLLCTVTILFGALLVSNGLSVLAVDINVGDDETVVFSFEESENPVMDTSDPNNLARGDDGIGCIGWGLRPRTDGNVNGLGYLHGNGGADWSDPGGYRLNNNDGVYNLETSTTYIVSFKLQVKSTPLNTSTLTNSMTSYVRFGYGFTGSTTGNTCSKMHVTVAEIVNAKSVASTDKEKGTFTLTTMAGSCEKTVGSNWYNLTFVFTTPESFGTYSPSLGFYSECYYGTEFMIDDVSVTKLGAQMGAVVLFDDYSESVTALTGKINNKVEFPTLEGKEESHEFIGWFKDEARTESADNVNFDYYNVLLTHRPENAKQYFNYDFDLVLSGHTHGGQGRIPFVLNGLYAPNQGFFPELAGGIYDFDDKKLIVSRGMSRENTELPRIFNRPELVFVVLKN